MIVNKKSVNNFMICLEFNHSSTNLMDKAMSSNSSADTSASNEKQTKSTNLKFPLLNSYAHSSEMTSHLLGF
ncbi:hypothetical protein L6452_38120 [Arctium lappa]|uniref:Uncharacterized protein n=1 Tax=Arctium lappa TaxID=4217 RepID=A0ACB8Y5M8_ARCLA|nr:hypothetical protein L6452_38120 [Arctium lappa]